MKHALVTYGKRSKNEKTKRTKKTLVTEIIDTIPRKRVSKMKDINGRIKKPVRTVNLLTSKDEKEPPKTQTTERAKRRTRLEMMDLSESVPNSAQSKLRNFAKISDFDLSKLIQETEKYDYSADFQDVSSISFECDARSVSKLSDMAIETEESNAENSVTHQSNDESDSVKKFFKDPDLGKKIFGVHFKTELSEDEDYQPYHEVQNKTESFIADLCFIKRKEVTPRPMINLSSEESHSQKQLTLSLSRRSCTKSLKEMEVIKFEGNNKKLNHLGKRLFEIYHDPIDDNFEDTPTKGRGLSKTKPTNLKTCNRNPLVSKESKNEAMIHKSSKLKQNVLKDVSNIFSQSK